MKSEETELSVEVRDHSLNLVGEADERDQGYGIEVLPDGSIQQGDAADEPAHAPADDHGERP